MYSEILSKIRTKEEGEKLLQEVEILIASLYEEEGRGFESALRTRVRQWVSDKLLLGFEKEGGDRQRYLKELKERLENLKTLGLTLAFEPTEASLDKFSSFIKKNLGEDVVLDISLDKSILGGAIIVWKGRWRDFSLRRLFEEEMAAKKEDLIQIFSTK